jgi:hypothetical protein
LCCDAFFPKQSVWKQHLSVLVILWLVAQAGRPGQLCWSHLSLWAVTAMWWHSLLHMSGNEDGCQLSHICVRSPQPSIGTRFSSKQQNRAQCINAFQASACVTLVNVSLAKSQQILTKTTYWINERVVTTGEDRDKDSWTRGTVIRTANPECVAIIKPNPC